MTNERCNTRIPWVRGNTLPLAVPLVLVTMAEGQESRESYYPPEGSEIHVWLVKSYKKIEYSFVLDDNMVCFTADGSLQAGVWGVEIRVKEPDARDFRMFKCKEIEIFECSDTLDSTPGGRVTLDPATCGESQGGYVLLDAAVFIQGPKGDKGDKGDVGEQGPPGTTDYNQLDNKPHIPSSLSELSQDSDHQTVTAEQKSEWSGKLDMITEERFHQIFN